MKKMIVSLLLAVGLLLSSVPPGAQADPLDEGITQTEASETVATAIFDADVQIQDVYLRAEQLTPDKTEIAFDSTSSNADRFRDTVIKNSDPKAEIVWKPENYSPSERIAASNQAMEEARLEGLTPTGATFDAETGQLTVFVMETNLPARREAMVTRMGDRTAAVVVESSPEDALESRYRGGSPWKAGTALSVSTAIPQPGEADCTSNFAWKKWGTGEVFSATANHCGNSFPNEVCQTGRREAWFNNGNAFGNLYFCNQQLDVQLIRRPTTAHIYSRDMWNGPPETSSFGTVTHTGVPKIGVRYYVSGANSGVQSAIVVNLEGTGVSGGPVVVMDEHVTQGGDSGAPWFSYLGNGKISAIGLHHGRVGGGSAFVPLNPISAHFQASVPTTG